MNIRWSLALSSMILIAGCGGDAAPPPEQERAALSVETEEIRYWTSPIVIEANGSVQPWARISPGTKLMGRIAEVNVQAGDRVQKGQQLAVLEKKDLEAAVQQASAELVMAEATHANAKIQFERISALHERGSVTNKNLEDATAGAQVSEASVMQAKAGLAVAMEMLNYATVSSPIDGLVTKKFVEPGDIAAPGKPMFTLEDLSKVKIVVQVPESDVTGIEPGDKATVLIDAVGVEELAVVDRVLPPVDVDSRTFLVELVLWSPQQGLRSGMFARMIMETGRREAVSIPHTAMVVRGALRGVFVVGEDAVAHLRWVRTGHEYSNRTEVISGLRVGDRIVVDPPPELTDGTPIE